MGQDREVGTGQDPGEVTAVFDTLQSRDMQNERRIFRSEIAIIAVVAVLVTAYLVALWWFSPGTLPVLRPSL